jgi:hypothetical protein
LVVVGTYGEADGHAAAAHHIERARMSSPSRGGSIARDGRSIAFESTRQGGRRIWIVQIDGTDPRPLSPGPANTVPMWRPDSLAILYLASLQDLWQINVDGSGDRSVKGAWPASSGDSARAFYPRAISLQGRLAGLVSSPTLAGLRLAFAPLDGSTPPKQLDLTVNAAFLPIAWAPDGQAIDVVRDAGNLWRYPIDGRPGVRLTSFIGNVTTRSFAWSADGRLVLSRGENKIDLVLFKKATSH